MAPETSEPIGSEPPQVADRIGFAKLTKMAFDGYDLRPLWMTLMEKVESGTAEAGEGLDLSLIAQLLGEKQTGLAIQAEVLAFHRLFRSPCAVQQPKLRVLALAAAIDMGGNTPIEFLLEGSVIELLTLYVMPDSDLSSALPEHDIAIVVASDSDDCAAARSVSLIATPRYGRARCSILPSAYAIWIAISCIVSSGASKASTFRRLYMRRGRNCRMGRNRWHHWRRSQGDRTFPIIIRPRRSHAGIGLAKLDDHAALGAYLNTRPEHDFFISRFVDYASEDGLFRKYRVVVVDGRPYACHMAISDQWNIWYLNAGMSGQCEQAPRRGGFHAYLRFRFCGAPSQGSGWNERARRSRLFHR